MELPEVLIKIGLNEKEARVYSALLELGQASAYAIAPKAQLKRPITYIVLEGLMRKGLVSQVPGIKKNQYVAEAPSKLLRDIQSRAELLKRFMPNMEAIYNARKEKPEVLMFEGIEGVKEVYRKIFESESVLFFGTSKEINKIDPSAWQFFLQKAKERKFKVKDLVTQSSAEDKKYAAQIKADPAYRSYYEIRSLPKNLEISADSAIFGDSIVFFCFRPLVFSVIINSKDIVGLMRAWYELAWQSAELI